MLPIFSYLLDGRTGEGKYLLSDGGLLVSRLVDLPSPAAAADGSKA